MSTRKILIVEDQALARAYLCSCVENVRIARLREH